MPTTIPVNMQQVLQMGTYTEKLQHTILSLPNVTAQQEDKKRIENDELKHIQVQDINPSDITENINYQNQSKKRDNNGRIQAQVRNEGNNIQLSVSEFDFSESSLPEDPRQGKMNIVV